MFFFFFFLTCDRRVHQSWVQSTEFLVPKSHLIQLARDVILYQHINLLDQVMNQLLALLGSKVHSDRLFVSIHSQEIRALLGRVRRIQVLGKRWTPCPRIVSSFRVLNLDYLSTMKKER